MEEGKQEGRLSLIALQHIFMFLTHQNFVIIVHRRIKLVMKIYFLSQNFLSNRKKICWKGKTHQPCLPYLELSTALHSASHILKACSSPQPPAWSALSVTSHQTSQSLCKRQALMLRPSSSCSCSLIILPLTFQITEQRDTIVAQCIKHLAVLTSPYSSTSYSIPALLPTKLPADVPRKAVENRAWAPATNMGDVEGVLGF